jgi:hypothetical protein
MEVKLNKTFLVKYTTGKWNVFKTADAVVIKQTEKAVLIRYTREVYQDGTVTWNGITMRGKESWTDEVTEVWKPKSIFCNLENWYDEKFYEERRDEAGEPYLAEWTRKVFFM